VCINGPIPIGSQAPPVHRAAAHDEPADIGAIGLCAPSARGMKE
jgi:hypothetical protein